MACEQRRNHGDSWMCYFQTSDHQIQGTFIEEEDGFFWKNIWYSAFLLHMSWKPLSLLTPKGCFLSGQWWWCSVTAVKLCDSAVNHSSVQGWHNLMPNWEWGREDAAWRENKKRLWEMLLQVRNYNQAKNRQGVNIPFKHSVLVSQVTILVTRLASTSLPYFFFPRMFLTVALHLKKLPSGCL